MRCLVTGASGHLGSFLTRHLLRQKHEVTAFVRPQSNLWRIADVLPQIKLIRGDLNAVQRAAPEAVYHLAWSGVTTDSRDDPQRAEENIAASSRLLEAVVWSGCKCWIGLGSQAEYGPHDAVLREDLPAQPVTPYGEAKLRVADLSRQACADAAIRWVWLRLLATYGPKDDERHLVPMVIGKLLARERPALTSGEQRWDYLYVEDAAEALYQAAQSKAEGAFNLASGDARPVREIVERIRDLIDPALPLGFGEVTAPVSNLEADIARLKQATGWAPRVPLEQGLKATVNWYREHRANPV